MGWAERAHDGLRSFMERRRAAEERQEQRDRQKLRDFASQIRDDAHLRVILEAVPKDHRAASLDLMRPYLTFTPAEEGSDDAPRTPPTAPTS